MLNIISTKIIIKTLCNKILQCLERYFMQIFYATKWRSLHYFFFPLLHLQKQNVPSREKKKFLEQHSATDNAEQLTVAQQWLHPRVCPGKTPLEEERQSSVLQQWALCLHLGSDQIKFIGQRCFPVWDFSCGLRSLHGVSEADGNVYCRIGARR